MKQCVGAAERRSYNGFVLHCGLAQADDIRPYIFIIKQHHITFPIVQVYKVKNYFFGIKRFYIEFHPLFAPL